MGTDWALLDYDNKRWLYLDSVGGSLSACVQYSDIIDEDVLDRWKQSNPAAFNAHGKGVTRFVRSSSPAHLTNEHHDDYDPPDDWKRFNIFAKTGHWKREGYGPE